jgi:hypothetical protein
VNSHLWIAWLELEAPLGQSSKWCLLPPRSLKQLGLEVLIMMSGALSHAIWQLIITFIQEKIKRLVVIVMANSLSRMHSFNWNICLPRDKYQFVVYVVRIIDTAFQGKKLTWAGFPALVLNHILFCTTMAFFQHLFTFPRALLSGTWLLPTDQWWQ